MRLFLLLLSLCSFSLFAQEAAKGIQFEEKSFDELLAQAKKADKLIFIDAYTTWCGPCKMMSSKVFPREEVGAVYNERFVNAKIDMEKGEGPALAQRYSVMAYPTYLFVNGDSELVHKGLGYIPAEQLLTLADVASSDENLLSLNKRYEAGERSSDFVLSYAKTLGEVYEKDKAEQVVADFLATQKDWSSKEIMSLIADNPGQLGGKRFTYMLENAEAFTKLTSAYEFYGNLQNIIIGSYMQAERTRELPEPKLMQAVYEKQAAAVAKRLSSQYELIYTERMSPEEYPAKALAFYKAYPSDNAMELNSVAWSFFEKVEDKGMLEQALEWAKQSVAMEEGYANMDTLAWLYEKLGRREEAQATAIKAIAIAKENGEDYSGTEELVKE